MPRYRIRVARDGAASPIGIAGMPTPPLSRCMAPAANAPLVRGGYEIHS